MTFVGPFFIKNIKKHTAALVYREEYNPGRICYCIFIVVIVIFSDFKNIKIKTLLDL